MAPSITSQPADQSAITGQPVTFSVKAAGTSPSYQWKKNGTDIPGATSSSYTILATTLADNGTKYSVNVSNSASTVTSNAATLAVLDKVVAPAITTQPAATQSVTAGQSATFWVAASGTSLKYQWKKGSAEIPGATTSSYSIAATSTADSGVYSLVVSNSTGAVTSNNATLTVTAAAEKPAITTQPAAQTVTAGQSATFSVSATGTSLSYEWKKNGTVISGATASSHTTDATVLADSGAVFTVVVSNSAGSVTSSGAALTVNAAPPAITVQPIAQTITAGTTATFTVAATGTGPLAFLWKKAGTLIPGATSNTYTTPAMSIAGTGVAYSVVVSNGVGTATSNTALLTVHRASATSDYAEVANVSGGTYAKTECVKDNSTGLVWEAKTDNGGARSVNDTFTNFDNTTSAQKGNGSNPTQAEIEAGTNSVGYALTMNSGSGLCGFHDWRLPTKDELNGIVNTSNVPKTDKTWFPYTSSVHHWTSSPIAGDPSKAICIIFNFQYDSNGSSCARGGDTAVRLVRGNQ